MEMQTMTFKQYRRTQIAEMRPWVDGDDMDRVSVSVEDMYAGSPKAGDMIARNPKNHADQWLVAAQYFADNFEPAADDPQMLWDSVAEKNTEILRLRTEIERLKKIQAQQA